MNNDNANNEEQLTIEELNSQIRELKEINSKNKEYFIFLELENHKLAQQVKKLKWEKKTLLSSTSWKITKPLRYVTNFFRKIMK